MTVQQKRGRPAATSTISGGGRYKFAGHGAQAVELPRRPGEPKPLGDVNGGCCWIHAAPPKRMFCGHKTVHGSSWCAHHYGRVYNRVPAMREAAE